MIRGPRSRAGLIAYPVGPPSARPMPTPEGDQQCPVASEAVKAPSESRVASTPNTSMNVPMISVTRLAPVLRIAGPVQYTASFRPGSSVSPQCTR